MPQTIQKTDSAQAASLAAQTAHNQPPEVPQQVVQKLSDSLQARFGSFDADKDKIVQFHCPHCSNVYKGTLKECIERMVVDDDQNGEILWRGCKQCWYKLDKDLPERSRLVKSNEEMIDALRFKVVPVVQQRDQYYTLLQRFKEERDELLSVVRKYLTGQADTTLLQSMLNAASRQEDRGHDNYSEPISFDPERWTKGLDIADCPL